MGLSTMESTLLFLLVLTGCCAGLRLLPAGPVYERPGTSVTFRTLVDNIGEESEILWARFDTSERTQIASSYKDTFVVSRHYTGRVSVNRTNGFMTMSYVTLGDSGNYSMAIVQNRKDLEGYTFYDFDALFTEFIELQVLDPISCTKITGPSETLFAGSSSANLSCEAKIGTAKTRTWLKDGRPLTANSHLMFSDDRSTLMFDRLEKEDNGEYTCQLRNPVSSDAASYKMAVSFGPEPAMVMGQSSVEMNNWLTFTCYAASSPPANFTWSFNGVETEVKTAEFTIEKATLWNAGTYTCEATNAITGKTTVYKHTLSVTVYFLSVVVCVVVIVLLSAALLLLLFTRKRNRTLGSRSKLSERHEELNPNYQRINPAHRDQDHVYSTIACT